MHADDARKLPYLIQHDAKPVADRLGGRALWRDIPREKRRSMTFSIVRDPLDRACFGVERTPSLRATSEA